MRRISRKRKTATLAIFLLSLLDLQTYVNGKSKGSNPFAIELNVLLTPSMDFTTAFLA
jgi:hypothetical protein